MEEKQRAVPVYAGVYEEIAEIIGKDKSGGYVCGRGKGVDREQN